MNADIIGGSIQQVANSLFVGVFVASAFIIGSFVAIYVKYSPKIKGILLLLARVYSLRQ